MDSKHYWGIAFDFDGTLFDTAELNYKAYRLAYFDLGVEITREMFARTSGLSVYDFNRAMGVDCDVEQLRALKAKYYKEVVEYARPNPYLLSMIYNPTTIRKALVTTARLCNINPLLVKYDLWRHFDVVITQDDVKKYKPDPEAYVLAAERMGVKPHLILAFEDTRAGFVSARNAGCDCIQINGFYDDCICKFTGGSDSVTKLLWTNGGLIVRKSADTEEAAKRLANQCGHLLIHGEPNVPVLEFSFNKKGFWYTMPYIMGVNLHEYQNKVAVLENVLQKIMPDTDASRRENCEDIREFCWETYLAPGVKIFERVTGKKRVLPWSNSSEIPERVNKFYRTSYHGDTTFENIIIQRDGNVVLIDPVPDGNAVNGFLHDLAKIGQSLFGYECIRDGVKDWDYTIERKIFQEFVRGVLTKDAFECLKFHIACLYFRRLKHQVEQNPKLVEPYGTIAFDLIDDFVAGNYLF